MQHKMFCIRHPNGDFMTSTLSYSRAISKTHAVQSEIHFQDWEYLYDAGYRVRPVDVFVVPRKED